jgi:hydroxymethylpyrimidine pyrophosphatase-like HAD family hydrolase
MHTTDIFVFDLDGVITNPHDTSVNEQAVRHIYDLLQKGEFVAVNTGRSYSWVEENLLRTLEHFGMTAFEHMIVVCEKGGENILWKDDSFQPQASRFALPDGVYETCKQLFETNIAQYATMFWDASKRTMATVEKRPEASMEDFERERQHLADALRAAAGQAVKIDTTTIATDIESPGAGKHAGAELIYEWIAQKADADTLNFVSFGDSISDYEMARYFAQQGQDSTFVFVGDKSAAFDEEPGVRLVRTDAAYADGTNEYFAQQGQS